MPKQKYIEFVVRAAYRPDDDTIHLTTKRGDLPLVEPIHLTLNRHSDAEETIRAALIGANVLDKSFGRVPERVEYPYGNEAPWHTVPLGQTRGGREITWDVRAEPHMLLAGPTGSGKSVVQRNILGHALRHREHWDILGVDLKRVELGTYRKYGAVKAIATDTAAAVDLLFRTRSLMMERYVAMEAAGVNHFTKLRADGKTPKAILLMIDEAYPLLASPAAYVSDGNRWGGSLREDDPQVLLRNSFSRLAQEHLLEIARLGRAAGIHLVIATQRPDAEVLTGELRNNLEMRVSAGRLSTLTSSVMFDTIAGTQVPKIKGRGLVLAAGGVPEETQFYWSDPSHDWYA